MEDDLVKRLESYSDMPIMDAIKLIPEAAAYIRNLEAEASQFRRILDDAEVSIRKEMQALIDDALDERNTARGDEELAKAALATAHNAAIEMAANGVRVACPACNGSGYAGPDEECAYCGIPMRAIAALPIPEGE
jgi:hypothetical protein